MSGSWPAIGLVAGREIATRITSKPFLWTTAVIVAAIVAGGLIVSTVAPSITEVPSRLVGVTSATASLAPGLEGLGAAAGVPLEVRTVASDSAGEDLVRDGTLDALLVGTAEEPTVVVDQALDPALDAVVTLLGQQRALVAEIEALEGDPAAVAAAIAEARPAVVTLAPPAGGEVDEGQLVTGMLSGVLIFIGIAMAGQLVAQGVVEEKTSRVVELLLATIRPWELMAGKIVGIGVIGLVQVVLVLGAGSAVTMATGILSGTGVDLGTTVLWTIAWFLLGYVMYATVLAAVAALVSRQEDVGGVTFPVIMVMMVPYIVGVGVAPTDPHSPLVEGLSFVPLFAPFLMPIRIAQGTAEAWQVAVALGLTLVLIPLLVWFAGLVYRNAVLRTGARVSLREALRRG